MTTNNCDNFTNPISVNTGGTTNTSFTAYGPIAAGTTSTGAFQSIAAGSSTNVLTSAGAGALPTWVADTGASILVATPTLTSAQIKAINTSPPTLISAPGSGKIIFPLSCSAKFNYGGTNAFTLGGQINIVYGIASAPIIMNAIFDVTAMRGTASVYGHIIMFTSHGTAATCENAAMSAFAAADFTGNAAGNNTLTFYITYLILTM